MTRLDRDVVSLEYAIPPSADGMDTRSYSDPSRPVMTLRFKIVIPPRMKRLAGRLSFPRISLHVID